MCVNNLYVFFTENFPKEILCTENGSQRRVAHHYGRQVIHLKLLKFTIVKKGTKETEPSNYSISSEFHGVSHKRVLKR